MNKEFCHICGSPNVEIHHIIFRSKAPYMKDAEINLISLCPEHHRGDNGAHKNRQIDLQLKEELQLQLLLLFNKEYYTEEEIQKLLNINKNNTRKLIKTLKMYDNVANKAAYKSYDIVKRCLGDRWYGDREDI